MAFVEPLNLQQVIINNIAGTVDIFIFITIIAISYGAARFQFPRSVYLMFLVMFGLLFSNYIGGLYVIMMLIIGFIVFIRISKVFN